MFTRSLIGESSSMSTVFILVVGSFTFNIFPGICGHNYTEWHPLRVFTFDREGTLQGGPNDSPGEPYVSDKSVPWYGNYWNDRNFEDNSWSEWSMCRHDLQTRRRTCDADQQSSADCFQARYCQPKMFWATWNSWSACDYLNGQYVRKRTRECLDSVGITLYGVVRCPGKSSETQICQNEKTYSEWSAWSTCDFRIGYQRSQRNCYGSECEGPVQVRLRRCQDDRSGNLGVWGEWSEWSACVDNSRERRRTCFYNACPGLSIQSEECTLTDSGWSAWESWSACNGHIQTRNRTCFFQNCHGFDSMSRLCSLSDREGGNNPTTTPPSQWSSWSYWSQCNKESQIRVRSCQGSSNCPGVAYETRTCTVQTTVRPTISPLSWTEWSVCRTDQTQTRSRQCPYSLSPCPVRIWESRVCTNDRGIQIDDMTLGDWSGWSAWSGCSMGLNRRTRTCREGAQCAGYNTETKTCLVHSLPGTGPTSHMLPTDGVGWGDWGPWDRNCVHGKRWRYRTCQTDSKDIGNCVGPSTDSVLCYT